MPRRSKSSVDTLLLLASEGMSSAGTPRPSRIDSQLSRLERFQLGFGTCPVVEGAAIKTLGLQALCLDRLTVVRRTRPTSFHMTAFVLDVEHWRALHLLGVWRLPSFGGITRSTSRCCADLGETTVWLDLASCWPAGVTHPFCLQRELRAYLYCHQLSCLSHMPEDPPV